MKIFLLSKTDHLQDELKNTMKEEIAKCGNTVAYISSAPQNDERPYYRSTIEDYSQISDDIKIDYFDLSEDFSDEKLAKLLEYGAIYLSGGNTYVFMDSARKRNIRLLLEKHLENGGLLIGASAGAIMMTPSIDLAKFGDENTPNLKDAAGFGFVDFEFCPHFTNKEEQNFLSEYMKVKNRELYTCKDGDGIFYSNGIIKLFGDVPKWK